MLVARDEARLDALARELESTGVRAEVLVADLADRAQLDRVADRLRREDAPVDLLVNNAGFGVAARFVGGELAAEEAMLDVLVRAVLVLTHAAAPGMVARGHGQIVTVSSVASFMTTGTYSAAKAWATTFSVSLARELAGSGVTVTALCPGFVRTEFQQRMGLRGQVAPSWAWLEADRLVADCLDDVDRGRVVSIPGRRYRVATAVLRHLPLRMSTRIGRRRATQRR